MTHIFLKIHSILQNSVNGEQMKTTVCLTTEVQREIAWLSLFLQTIHIPLLILGKNPTYDI